MRIVAYFLNLQREIKFTRKKFKEYPNILAVLKSDKKDAYIPVIKTARMKRKGKKSYIMNADNIKQRDDNSSVTFLPPSKVFSLNIFLSKKIKKKVEERLEF